MTPESSRFAIGLRAVCLLERQQLGVFLRVLLMAFLVVHSVSTYRSSSMTILGFAVALSALAATRFGVKDRPSAAWQGLTLAGFFLSVWILTDLPWASPLTSFDQTLQRIGFVAIAFLLSFFPPVQVLTSYTLAGLYISFSAIPLLVYEPQQAIFQAEGLSGWFHDNNQFGQVVGLTFVAAVSAFLFAFKKSSRASFLAFFGALLLGVFLMFSNSLTPIGAAAIAIISGLIGSRLNSLPNIPVPLAGFVGVSVPLVIVVILNSLGAFSLVGRSTNFHGRAEIWSALLPVLPEFLFGVDGGIWNTDTGRSISESIGFSPESAHNSFLELYLSAGVFPFALFMVMIGHVVVVSSRGTLALDSRQIGFGITLIYILVHSFFESSLWSNFLFLGFFVSYFGILNEGASSDNTWLSNLRNISNWGRQET